MSFGNKFTRFVYDNSPAGVRNLVTTVYSRKRSKVKFGHRFYEYLADLERTQWYSTEQLQALQDEKVRRMVAYAYRFVPYYREVFGELGMEAMDIRGAADLQQLPLLTKLTLQTRLPDFRSTLYRDPELVEHFQTSGTTGRALDIYVSKDCLQLEKAFTWLHRGWGGVQFGNRTAAFVGFPVVPVKQARPPFWVFDRAENRMIFSLQHMSAVNLPAYADALRSFKPQLVTGYPTALYLMALQLNDTRVLEPSATVVTTASETLMPHQRTAIERAFGCQILDWYGASEIIANIVQCEAGNYHIKAEYGAVEIVRPDGTPCMPGEEGELVCSGLNNAAMPLLRYRVGDTAVPKSGGCPCGRGGALIETITGRVEDVIVCPDGRLLSRLDFVFKGMTAVEEAQLIQATPDFLSVRIVPRPSYSEQDEKRIIANLRERIGNDMEIRIEPVERIPRTANGKFRYVISKVPLPGTLQTGEVLGLSSDEDKLPSRLE
jgi:phenylacetate-CoA ligase